MIMRKLYVFILPLLLVINIYSQQVSIELAVEWKIEKSDSSNNIKDIRNVPYLKITYNNLSDNPIYFFKVYSNHSNIPSFLTAFPSNNGDILEKYIDFDVRYNVIVGGMPFRNLGWDVIPDSINLYSIPEPEMTTDIINDVLYYF